MNKRHITQELERVMPVKNSDSHATSVADAAIKQAVRDDPDTFMPDARWMRNARVVLPKAKQVVTLRLDPDVLAWFRHDGKGYQTRINAVLRAFVEAQRE